MRKFLALGLLLAGCGGTLERESFNEYFSTRSLEKFGDLAGEGSGPYREVISQEGGIVTINALHLMLKEEREWAEAKLLIVNAGTVEIQEPFRLPGGSVVINAEKLTIALEGSIDITPPAENTRPSPGANGSPGIDGGNIVLNVAEMDIAADEGTVFIARGGDGDPAGLGRDGKAGKSLPVVGEKGLVYYYNSSFHPAATGGRKAWPGNGGDATPGGRPGNPGDGGAVLTTLKKALPFIDVSGGAAGAKAPVARGGRPGQPNPARQITIHEIGGLELEPKKDRGSGFPGPEIPPPSTLLREQVSEHHSKAGKDAPAPEAEIAVGEPGKGVLLKREKLSWVSQGYAKMLARHARERHLAGDFASARKLWFQLGRMDSTLAGDFTSARKLWVPTLAGADEN